MRMFDCIAHIYWNNQISVVSVFKVEAFPPSLQLPPHLNSSILNKIQNGTAFATCDTSIKNDKMGVY